MEKPEIEIKDLNQFKVTIEIYFPTWQNEEAIKKYFRNYLGIPLESIKIEKL